jgi:hypothetical protein
VTPFAFSLRFRNSYRVAETPGGYPWIPSTPEKIKILRKFEIKDVERSRHWQAIDACSAAHFRFKQVVSRAAAAGSDPPIQAHHSRLRAKRI